MFQASFFQLYSQQLEEKWKKVPVGDILMNIHGKL